MYYGLFVRIGGRRVRVDTTAGFTLETAKKKFSGLVVTLMEAGLTPLFCKLPPVKQIDERVADKKYAKTPW